jgi:GTP-binding protein HflX
MAKLRREISGMKQVRATQRGARRRHDVPSVAIVGYTNAGKSSLLNALTGAGVLVENALFATLDPTTRRTSTADGRTYTLTDTVGFVRHLPHQLVEAFRSTLEETAAADLLVHVVDASDPLPEDQIKAVRQVLVEIGEEYGSMPHELLVVNKTDAAGALQLARLRHLLPDALFVSARSGDGIGKLRERIAELLPTPEVELDLLLPYVQGSLVARVHTEGEVLSEEHTPEGTRMRARVGAELATTVLPYALAGAPEQNGGPAH